MCEWILQKRARCLAVQGKLYQEGGSGVAEEVSRAVTPKQ